jgi:hypothetical protein
MRRPGGFLAAKLATLEPETLRGVRAMLRGELARVPWWRPVKRWSTRQLERYVIAELVARVIP